MRKWGYTRHLFPASLAATLSLFLLLASPGWSSAEGGGMEDRITALQKQIDQLNAELQDLKKVQEKQTGGLAEELRKLKLEVFAPAEEYESYTGLGPAASKVYFKERGLSIGGYGELNYEGFRHDSKKDRADAQRIVLYTGYKFSDKIVMNAEFEYEHAGINNVGGSTSGVTPTVSNSRQPEVYVEFANLDFLLDPRLNVRTGLLLTPVGLINEYHEPTVYHGVLRPDVERNLIPSTWRDLGAMAYGSLKGFDYKLGVLSGLRADRLSSSDWIRGGRQQGAVINAEGFASVGRLDYRGVPGLVFGGTYYFGQADFGRGGDTDPVGKGERTADINLWELHADYKFKGLELRGLFTRGTLDGNRAFESSPPGSVGEKAQGWYLETAYDLMPLVRPGSLMSLTPFVRYESYDTHREVFSGRRRNPSLDREVFTFGLGFRPHPNVILKVDYQWRDTDSDLPAGKGTGRDENKIDQFNFGLGFIF